MRGERLTRAQLPAAALLKDANTTESGSHVDCCCCRKIGARSVGSYQRLIARVHAGSTNRQVFPHCLLSNDRAQRIGSACQGVGRSSTGLRWSASWTRSDVGPSSCAGANDSKPQPVSRVGKPDSRSHVDLTFDWSAVIASRRASDCGSRWGEHHAGQAVARGTRPAWLGAVHSTPSPPKRT